jgi:hypothetical protein
MSRCQSKIRVRNLRHWPREQAAPKRSHGIDIASECNAFAFCNKIQMFANLSPAALYAAFLSRQCQAYWCESSTCDR